MFLILPVRLGVVDNARRHSNDRCAGGHVVDDDGVRTEARAIADGADIVPVPDVREMTRVARMADAVVRGWTKPEAAKA